MDELKWELLAEIQGRAEAEILKAYLIANGIEDVELFQEALGQHVYPTTLDLLGNVQLFVPKAQSSEARQLFEEYEELPPVQPEEDPLPPGDPADSDD